MDFPRSILLGWGHLLCDHMRAVKFALAKSKAKRVAPHQQRRIDAHNLGHAVRIRDVIDVHQKKATKVRGSGNTCNGCPVPSNVHAGASARLRSNWHDAEGQTSREYIFRQRQVQHGIWPGGWMGAPSHVRNIRCAMASHFLKLQGDALKAMPHADFILLELSFDETEMQMELDSHNETAHLMTIHVRMCMLTAGKITKHDIIVAPAVIEACVAAKSFFNRKRFQSGPQTVQ